MADPAIVQRPAEEVDPDTDIAGALVTVKVDPLSDRQKTMALSQAMEKAKELLRRRVIIGAYVVVQGKAAATDFFHARLVHRENGYRREGRCMP